MRSSAIAVLAFLAAADAVMQSQSMIRHRLQKSARRLGAALRKSSPQNAAAAYARLRKKDAETADALRDGAQNFGYVLMPVPVLTTPPLLDEALADFGSDLRAMSHDDNEVFDHLFAEPMAGQDAYAPFDMFGALRNATGWTRSSEFRSNNGTSYARVCENGKCTEYTKTCQDGSCKESKQDVKQDVKQTDDAAIHAQQHASSEVMLGNAQDTSGHEQSKRKLRHPQSRFHHLFNDDIFDVFAPAMEWPHALQLPRANHSGASSKSYSETSETRMENGVLYQKVCRNGECKETRKKCSDWNCSESM